MFEGGAQGSHPRQLQWDSPCPCVVASDSEEVRWSKKPLCFCSQPQPRVFPSFLALPLLLPSSTDLPRIQGLARGCQPANQNVGLRWARWAVSGSDLTWGQWQGFYEVKFGEA